jgi:hypothetical protein
MQIELLKTALVSAVLNGVGVVGGSGFPILDSMKVWTARVMVVRPCS